MIPDPSTVANAYRHCTALARSHYENFPVASWLLPRALREPVAAIYAFARHADDLADEGEFGENERTAALDAYRQQLRLAVDGRPSTNDPVFIALADSIARHELPPEPLEALLDAFAQDVRKRRYADFGEVMDYCRNSANPIGRLLLHLAGQATPENLACSDAVCSALQLINFHQDLHEDYVQRGRLYLPLDELQHYDVNPEDIGSRRNSPQLLRLMRHQYDRADRLLRSGAPLGRNLHGRMGLEVRAIIVGGARILYRLRQQSDDVFARPRLNAADRFAILHGAFIRSAGD